MSRFLAGAILAWHWRHARLGWRRGTAIFKGVVPVAMFGAKGDGAHNDGPAIQATIDALSRRGGGVVKLDEGAYTVREPLEVPEGKLTLQGAGRGITSLRWGQ